MGDKDTISTRRTVQQLGSSTLGMTIPKQWITQQELSKGDDIIVQENGINDSIIVVPAEQRLHTDQVTLTVEDLSTTELTQLILTQYILCKQTIHIKNSNQFTPEQYNAITEVEQRLIGVGIIEEQRNCITVRCSVSPSEFDIGELIKQIHQTETKMRTDALSGFLDGNDAIQQIVNRHGRTGSLFFLLLRVLFITYKNPKLNKEIGINTGFPLMGYRSIAQDLILMTDIDQQIAAIADKSDTSALDNNTSTLITDLVMRLDEAVGAAVTGITEANYTSANTSTQLIKKVRTSINTLNGYLETVRPEPLLGIQRVSMLLDRHAVFTNDISKAALRLALHADSPTCSESGTN